MKNEFFIINYLYWFTFTFMNLADTFIQIDVQSIQAIHFLTFLFNICL